MQTDLVLAHPVLSMNPGLVLVIHHSSQYTYIIPNTYIFNLIKPQSSIELIRNRHKTFKLEHEREGMMTMATCLAFDHISTDVHNAVFW